MKLKCLIIDDEPIARKLLQEYIEETDFLELVGVAEHPLKAAGLINSITVDLIFLDINMPKMSGLEFLRSAPNLPMVILTTAYGQYALDGFELAVVDYLVKPFSLERFLKACIKAFELKALKDGKSTPSKSDGDHFFVKCEGKIEKIAYHELIYLEAMANYVVLHTINDKMVVYLTIKGILEKLPASQFVQVHKSYIVNIEKINTIEGNMLHLGSKKITMGLNYADGVMDRVLKNRFIKR
ncbi:LytTR family DNA-binding domain-containing protein [Mucilaginibacter sabulilitoris]|uniref:LytTR family DNA-binding domain-containing protein n=1 Tax=Mucilaginibacter sabulilitoris TaxID=1173583 RepID=A0ABZ0TVD5_9SPHI|nr:LytTR family DNA-binding domain-containing protein [Mucilaginibacter sabulilitoris]WPU97048.1 LytTR family DNA-binding domain-containing protein [Mucilaginibacter sabulilitoris]